jgi:heat shock protein HslJ
MVNLMKTNAIRLMLALAVISAAAVTFAHAQKSSGENPLSGTSWQLVKFQGPDGETFAPEDKSKYTITFRRDGRVVARVDCNRAASTWKATTKGELQFGSWSRTNMKCGPGSLHDRIVSEGADVQTFAIKDGRLFLSGGGYYELEPLPKRNSSRS